MRRRLAGRRLGARAHVPRQRPPEGGLSGGVARPFRPFRPASGGAAAPEQAAAGRNGGGAGAAAGGVACPAGAELHPVRLQVGAPQRPAPLPGQRGARQRPAAALRAAGRAAGAAEGGETRPRGGGG